MKRKQGKNGSYLDLYPESDYDPTVYERPVYTADICLLRVHEGQLKSLMIRRGQAPFKGMLANPGGFVDINKGETSLSAAYRELGEEANVTSVKLKPFWTYDDPNRDPRWRTITKAFYALLSEEQVNELDIVAGDDALKDSQEWVPLKNTPEDLAFDHAGILGDLMTYLEDRLERYPIAFEFLSDKFSWGQLQEVYEAISGRSEPSPNFRRKMKRKYKLEELPEKFSSTGGRPPILLKRAE